MIKINTPRLPQGDETGATCLLRLGSGQCPFIGAGKIVFRKGPFSFFSLQKVFVVS